jgi:hypothetical protein
MRWDTFDNQWFLWIGVTVLLALVWAAAYKFYKLNPYKSHKSKIYEPIQNQQNEDGWTPTGRIDFSNGQAMDHFILQAEDTRIIQSIGGVEHREIRWRQATLDEAKAVIRSYHAQRNLTMTADLITNSRRKADLGNEEHKDHPGNEPATENPPR